MFCFVLEFLLNTHKKTGISIKKIDKEVNVEHESFDNLKSIITYAINNPTGKDCVVATIKDFINSIPSFIIREFVKQLITKKYKVGCTSKQVSEILPDIIAREFSVRKGYALTDADKQLKGREFIVTTKYDGHRVVIIKDFNRIDIYSSGGHKILGLKDIIYSFFMPTIPYGVYDGEMLAIGSFTNSTERFQATEKLLTKDGDKTGLVFECFDYIEDVNAWESFKAIEKSCIDRKNQLRSILISNSNNQNYKYVHYVEPLYIGTDVNEIYKAYDKLLSEGEEGVIIDIASSPHVRNKGTTMFKLKEVNTLDLPIIDVKEGTGKDKGRLGAFICQYKNTTVSIGSGLTDELKEEVWNNPQEYIGRVIEIHCQDESTNQNGEESLRQPRFKRFREKGKTPSYE